jgi:hypothetical protein
LTRAAATSSKKTNDDGDSGPRSRPSEERRGWEGDGVVGSVVVFVGAAVVDLFSAKRTDPGGEPEEALAKTDNDVSRLPLQKLTQPLSSCA